MELTRTDVVFSRISMVLFMCRSKRSQNDLKLHGATFQKIRKIPAKDEGLGGHHLATRVGARLPPRARPLPRGPHVASPTPTPPPYIEFRGEKKSRRRNHRVLRYGAAIASCSSSGGQIWSPFGAPDLGSRGGNLRSSSSPTLLHHQFHDAHRHA